MNAQHQFSPSERELLYRLIALRRDTRHFQAGAQVDGAVLQRLLLAAHQAPSVGLMEPWRFIRLRDPALREQASVLVAQERDATAEALGERAAEFLRLKVEGMRECAEVFAIVLSPDDGTVFGRRSMPREMALCSAACAVENLWLAARAENLGMGWVSMFDPVALGKLLGLPQGAMPIGLLCIGPVERFYEQRMLEQEGWRLGRLSANPDAPLWSEDRWQDETPSPALPAAAAPDGTDAADLIPQIDALHEPELAAALRLRIDEKTKPLGALGQLEELMLKLGLILGTEAPLLQAPQMLVFAGDHGLAARGVSAYSSDVTWQMVENFLAGGAAVNVLARQHGLSMTVVDAGVRHDFVPRPGLVIAKVAPGTADALSGPAMSAAQCATAIRRGRDLLRQRPGNAVLLGEMGIGNSSSAALLLARVGGHPIEACVGRGTGLDDAQLRHKTAVLAEVLARHPQAQAPLEALSAFGGFEIAMMTGAVLQAALERRVILVDGFIASSAVLVASRLQPAVLQRCVFAHRSQEPGHQLMLAALQAQPLLDLGLRLGEGSGAALAWPLLVSACKVLREMASFAQAGVSRKA
jgi:nicotinate-nucleotide--dimethylbenzimidazole phosphoribosyltransferase